MSELCCNCISITAHDCVCVYVKCGRACTCARPCRLPPICQQCSAAGCQCQPTCRGTSVSDRQQQTETKSPPAASEPVPVPVSVPVPSSNVTYSSMAVLPPSSRPSAKRRNLSANSSAKLSTLSVEEVVQHQSLASSSSDGQVMNDQVSNSTPHDGASDDAADVQQDADAADEPADPPSDGLAKPSGDGFAKPSDDGLAKSASPTAGDTQQPRGQ